jgi:hypothetical protein
MEFCYTLLRPQIKRISNKVELPTTSAMKGLLMKLNALFLLLGVFFAQTSFAWVSSHSGNDSIRIVSHTGEVLIENEFVKTTISLTFANRGQQKEGAIYQFAADYGSSVTNLEIKIGKTWQKGILLESNQAREAYSAITGLDTTPRNIDPGLLVKDSTGSFTLHVYPVPAGGTLEARFTLIGRAIFDGNQFYYSYPDVGDETTATPKLSISIAPPTGRVIDSATFAEIEAKVLPGKGAASQIQVKPAPGYGGAAALSWRLKPPSAAVPTPSVEMFTTAGTKNDSFLYMRFSLDPATPAQAEMNESLSYSMMAVTYDTPLPEGSLCAGNNPYYLDPGTSYWTACWIPGVAPKSSQSYFSKNSVSLDNPITSTAKTLDVAILSAVFLAEVEDNYYLDQLLTQEERNNNAEDNSAKTLSRFFTIADRYGVVTTMTSLLAIDPSDEFSRDVVAFSKKWGARYASSMLGGVAFTRTVTIESFSVGSISPNPVQGASAGGLGEKPKAGGGTALNPPRFYDPFETEPTTNLTGLSAASPSKVLRGSTADRDKIVAALKGAELGACLNGVTINKYAALALEIENGVVVDLAFYDTAETTACGAALRAVALPKVSVEFVILLSALQGK